MHSFLGGGFRYRSIDPRLPFFVVAPVHAKNGNKRRKFHPAGIILRARMADEPTGIHTPLRFAKIQGGNHAPALVRHALKSGSNVSRPLRISILDRPQVIVSVDRPDSFIRDGTLPFIKHSPHIHELQIVKQGISVLVCFVVPPCGGA